jgi:ABC-2 type transport system ATP-binding protein
MSDDPVIAVHGLARRFGDLVAVAGVDLEVRPGEIFGVLGPNGAGKSTTIRMLCGLLTPTGGSGTVLGHDLMTDSEAIKRGIGYMTQSLSLYADLSVDENLRSYAGLHGLPFFGTAARVEEQVARYGLRERRGQVVGTLSGGWRQRVALACATIHAPRLLFLDEPTAGVDPVSRRDFWQLIGAVARTGTAVVVTTHYMDEAERFDRLAFIFRGRQLDVGTPAELVARSGLRVGEAERDDPVAEAARCTVHPRVVEAAVLGRTVRVVVRDGDPAAVLTGAREVRATIEDAFVALARDPAEVA